jgi:signal transduction histidine kinase
VSASNPARAARMPVSQSLSATIGLLLAFAVVGIGLALLANAQLNHRRSLLLEEIGPSLRAAIRLEDALVNEETGVRGYVIAGQRSFLEPYESGLATEADAYRELHRRERSTGPLVAAEVEAVRSAAQAWRARYVDPILAEARPTNRSSQRSGTEGRHLFDAIRAPLGRLQAALTAEDQHIRSQLNEAANLLFAALLVAAALIFGSLLAAGLFLRRMVTRPLARLGAQAKRVTGGDFATPLAAGDGPREIADLAAEMDAMRERIVHELQAVQDARRRLARQAEELSRSNDELEQFAYVASHDLQEPLRKIASFCQALQLRYGGQLDERADRYIEFAVDGAKRMQLLVNALLALSRVGRGQERRVRVALDDVLAEAQTPLAAEIHASGARILSDPLPEVLGDRTLLVSLLQNLIGNAVKFRTNEPPSLRIGCTRDAQAWELSFTDNGIGIEPAYAERIFQIFQRLHGRDSYEGTGIGLSLCRKIVEYHGGHIWLDTAYERGACFRLTLPTIEAAASLLGSDNGAGTEATRGAAGERPERAAAVERPATEDAPPSELAYDRSRP